MKNIILSCAVWSTLAIALGGCSGAEKPQARPASAAQEVAAQPAPVAPAAPAAQSTEPPASRPARIGGRMQLAPVGADKFHLGPKAETEKKADGSK